MSNATIYDAERDLLSILLNEPFAIGHVSEIDLRPVDFSDAAHRSVFGTIKSIYDRGDDPGLELVQVELDRIGTNGQFKPGELEIIAAQMVRPEQLIGIARRIKVAALVRLAESYAERQDYEMALDYQRRAESLANGKRPDRANQPAFPIDALPDPVRSLVQQGAAASDIDPAFVALPMLGIVGGLIGPKLALQLKRGWNETAQLWLAVVAEPGRGKTPGEKHARTGLEKLQSEAHKQYEEAFEAYQSELSEWSSMPRDDRGPKPQPPKMTSYYSADTTMEALTTMLAIRPGLAVLRDELVSWVRSCDAYRGGKGGDRSAWLSLWSGVPVKVDRKSGKPVFIEEPVVSVAGGVQPQMLPALAEEANRRDGFIERMLFAFPADHIPGWTEDELDVVTVRQVENQLRRLVEMPDCDEPLRLSPRAHKRWMTWYEDNTELQSSVSGILGGIYAKLPIQLARLTIILHVLNETQDLRESGSSRTSGESVIAEEVLESAIRLIEYFRKHAHRVVPLFGEVAPRLNSPEQQRILDYHRDQGPATSQEVADALGMKMKSVNEIQQKLVGRGLLYQPAYGAYAVPNPPERNITSTGSTGTTGNTQNLLACSQCGHSYESRHLDENGVCFVCAEPEGVPF